MSCYFMDKQANDYFILSPPPLPEILNGESCVCVCVYLCQDECLTLLSHRITSVFIWFNGMPGFVSFCCVTFYINLSRKKKKQHNDTQSRRKQIQLVKTLLYSKVVCMLSHVLLSSLPSIVLASVENGKQFSISLLFNVNNDRTPYKKKKPKHLFYNLIFPQRCFQEIKT